MSHDRAVIRVEPNGPKITGLTPWDSMDPENLVEGTPVQRGHIYHENPDAGIMVGVWDCTAFTEHMAPYPVDEFMYLLEGDTAHRLARWNGCRGRQRSGLRHSQGVRMPVETGRLRAEDLHDRR